MTRHLLMDPLRESMEHMYVDVRLPQVAYKAWEQRMAVIQERAAATVANGRVQVDWSFWTNGASLQFDKEAERRALELVSCWWKIRVPIGFAYMARTAVLVLPFLPLLAFRLAWLGMLQIERSVGNQFLLDFTCAKCADACTKSETSTRAIRICNHSPLPHHHNDN